MMMMIMITDNTNDIITYYNLVVPNYKLQLNFDSLFLL